MTENIQLKIDEVNANLSQERLPCFYKYRYTFLPKYKDLEEQKSIAKEICIYVRDKYMIKPVFTLGIEHYTKGMLECKPHMHLHFVSKHTSDSIRKGLASHFPHLFIGRVQSCKAEVLVDELKFYRYPLKQQLNETKKLALYGGFEKDTISNMTEIAYQCWLQSAEIYVGKLEKKIERSSRDRLFTYLDDRVDDWKTAYDDSKLYIWAYTYFVEHEPNFNVSTVNGYVHIYLLKNGLISYSDFYLKYRNA